MREREKTRKKKMFVLRNFIEELFNSKHKDFSQHPVNEL